MSRLGYAVPAAPRRPYVTGRYYVWRGHYTPTSTGSTSTATITRFRPVYLDSPATIASLIFRITTLAAAGNCKFAIYAADPNTLAPTGAPLYTSANQTTAAAGNFEIASVNLSLGAGWYVVASQVDNATVVLQGFGTSDTGFVEMAGGDAVAGVIQAANHSQGWQKSGTVFGTFPTLTGNLTTDSLAFTGQTVFTGFKAG